MKILFIGHQSFKLYGANRSLLSVLRYFSERGHECLVVNSGWGSFCRFVLKLEKVKVIKLFFFDIAAPLFSLKWVLLPVTYLWNYFVVRELESILKKDPVDIIYSNTSSVLIGAHLSRKTGIPHIWQIREYGFLDYKLMYFPSLQYVRRLMSLACKTLPITQEIGNFFLPDAENSKIIYNGIITRSELESKSKHLLSIASRKSNQILLVGYLSFNKGQLKALRAFYDAKSYLNEYELVIVGSGSLVFELILKALIKTKYRKLKIQFHGFQGKPETFFQSAKILIVPSSCEGLGRVTLEGFLNGCIVIGSDSGGTRDLLKNGKNGLLFDGSVNDLSRQLILASQQKMVSLDVLYERIKLIEERFLIDTNMKLMEQEFTECLSAKH